MRCAQCKENAKFKEKIGTQLLPVCSKLCKDLLLISEKYKPNNLMSNFTKKYM